MKDSAKQTISVDCTGTLVAPVTETDRTPEMQQFVTEARNFLGFLPFDGKRCVDCAEPYSTANVYTEAGWAEIRISGLCERCFDAMAEEGDESDDDEPHDCGEDTCAGKDCPQ